MEVEAAGSYDSARGVLRTYEVEGDDGMVIWHSWGDDGYDDPDDDDGHDDALDDDDEYDDPDDDEYDGPNDDDWYDDLDVS